MRFYILLLIINISASEHYQVLDQSNEYPDIQDVLKSVFVKVSGFKEAIKNLIKAQAKLSKKQLNKCIKYEIKALTVKYVLDFYKSRLILGYTEENVEPCYEELQEQLVICGCLGCKKSLDSRIGSFKEHMHQDFVTCPENLSSFTNFLIYFMDRLNQYFSIYKEISDNKVVEFCKESLNKAYPGGYSLGNIDSSSITLEGLQKFAHAELNAYINSSK